MSTLLAAPPARTLFGTVFAWAQRAPAALAVICAQGRFTYSELDRRARRAAAALHAAGVRRGDRVGLLLANRIEWIDLCLGAGALGATTVPLSTWSTRAELAFLIGDAKLALLAAQSSFGERDFHADLRVGFPVNRRVGMAVSSSIDDSLRPKPYATVLHRLQKTIWNCHRVPTNKRKP